MNRAATLLLGNWPWKLLSLSAATILWVAVASEPEMATFLRVPVVYRNAPQNLEISSTIETFARVQVTGVSGRLRDAAVTPSPVVVDLSSVRSPGIRTFNIDASDVRLPPGVDFVSAAPAQLRFVFEKRLEKTVPVHVQWSGVLPDGKRLVRAQPDPSQMTVVGPASHVNLVQAVSTDPVDLGQLRNGEVVQTSPFVDQTLVRFQKSQTIHVRVILKN